MILLRQARLETIPNEWTAHHTGKARAGFRAQQDAHETYADDAFPCDIATSLVPYYNCEGGKNRRIVAGRALKMATFLSEVHACPKPDGSMHLDELCADVFGAP